MAQVMIFPSRSDISSVFSIQIPTAFARSFL
jgi:hypothetical protein